MSEKDGGSAFPQVTTDEAYAPSTQTTYGDTYSFGGMSLRDYFAGQALIGWNQRCHNSCVVGSQAGRCDLLRTCRRHARGKEQGMRTEVPNYEPDVDREDQDAREVRWAEFVQVTRNYLMSDGFGWVLQCALGAYEDNPPERYCETIESFAETEGWSGVLSAIASAMRAEERERKEMFERR